MHLKGEIFFGQVYRHEFEIVSPDLGNSVHVGQNVLHHKNKAIHKLWIHNLSEEVRNVLDIHLQGIVYHFEDTSSSSPLKKINELNDNRYLRRSGENLAAFLYFLQQKHQKEFQNIENQIHSVAPFFDIFDLAPDRLNENQIELVGLKKVRMLILMLMTFPMELCVLWL